MFTGANTVVEEHLIYDIYFPYHQMESLSDKSDGKTSSCLRKSQNLNMRGHLLLLTQTVPLLMAHLFYFQKLFLDF